MNFFHAALVLLAVCASGWLVTPDGLVRRARTAWLVAAFTPVLALIVASYTMRPPVPLTFEGQQLSRDDATHLSRLYRWIRSETPGDAVFVIDPGPPIRAMAGNTAELPALTERTLFTARSDHYLVTGHADAARRSAIARRLLSGDALSARDAALVSGLGRSVYLVVDGAARSARPAALRARRGAPTFQSGPLAVWQWTEPSSGAPHLLE